MSEYQYYEFCNVHSPLTSVARKEMTSLSSRTRIGTHGVSYVYNYGDFRGDPKKLLLKHFEVFFYISNWGSVQLMFKYPSKQVDIFEIKKYQIKDVINIEQQDHHVILALELHNEEGGDWIEGEGLLPDLLPLYEEIKAKNYQILHLISAVHNEWMGKNRKSLDQMLSQFKLSEAQEAFLKSASVNYKVAS